MDILSKTKVLKQLARTSGKIAQAACEKEAEKIASVLQKETRTDVLEQQLELLNIFAFRVPEKAIELVRSHLERLQMLDLSYETEATEDERKLGKDGERSRIIVGALNLLDRIRYYQPHEVLEIIVEQYESEDDKVHAKAVEGLQHLAEYNIDIFFSGKDRAGIGPAPQLAIIDWLDSLDHARQRKHFYAIIELCTQLLSPSMSSTTADYKSVIWSKAAIPATEEIKTIRRRGLRLLTSLYDLAKTTDGKKAILNAMLIATHTPHPGEYGDDVLDMVIEDARQVLAFFRKLTAEEDFQVVQKVEHDTFWTFRHLPNTDVKPDAFMIRDLLEGNKEYAIYKQLIGFDGVFEDWDESLEKDPDFREIEESRSQKAKEYADSINEENWAQWRERIIRFAQIESNDLATFSIFYGFLERLSDKSPDLAFGLLTERLDDVQFFTIPLLRGLWKGPLQGDLRVLILKWIEEDQQLNAIAKLFLSNEDIDEELLLLLMDRAEEGANRDLLILLLSVSALNYGDGHEALIPKVFLPSLSALARMKDNHWVQRLWYHKELVDVISNLDNEGQEIVLRSLLPVRDIDYHAEPFLIPLANKNPERILAFFGERLRYEESAEREWRYDAIPFRFHKLHTVLAEYPEIAVQEVRSWFRGNWALFQYRGADFLKKIFQNWSYDFESVLLVLIRSGDREEVEFVLSILANYEGEPFIHGVCREIIVKLPENDELLSSVGVVLRNTGVVAGEFGFAEAYERKVEEIKPWLTDENERVRNFASGYIKGCEEEARCERARVEEDIELRKHAYGVREEEAGGEAENG